MRLGCFLLSIALAFVVNCNAAAARSPTKPRFPNIQLIPRVWWRTTVQAKRFLRTEGVKVNDEERGMTNKLPSSFVSNLVRKDSLRARTFQDWAKADDGIDLDGLKAVLKATTNNAKIKDQKALLKLYEEFLG